MQGEIEMGRKNYADAVRIFYRVAFGHGYPDAPPEYHPWQAAAMFDAARSLEQLGKTDAARKLRPPGGVPRAGAGGTRAEAD